MPSAAPSPCVSCGPLSPAGLQPAVPGSATTPRAIPHIQPVAQTAERSLAATLSQQIGQTFRERAMSAGKGSTASSWKKAPQHRWAALEGLSGDLPGAGPFPPLL